MTREELRDSIRGGQHNSLLDTCLRDDAVPFVFEPRPASWSEFRAVLVTGLGVERESIRVVGSGRLGFSLKPGRNLRAFADTSDIDVMMVDASLFDRLWISLLEAAYPRPPMTNSVAGWLKTRRTELYTGWLTPLEFKLNVRIVGEKARPVLEFNSRWFNALKQASRLPPRRHEDVTGRLYRTWRHAELYHINSLLELQRSLA